MMGKPQQRPQTSKSLENGGGEMQVMLPQNLDNQTSGEVCLLAESPYRILRVSYIKLVSENNFQSNWLH